MLPFLSAIGFAAAIKGLVLVLVCVAYSVAVEQTLYHKDLTFAPLWRPMCASLIVFVAHFAFLNWTQMTPMESVFMYGGADASTLRYSIIAFILVEVALVAFFCYTSISRMAEETLFGGQKPKLFALRVTTVLPSIALLVYYWIVDNRLVGEDGFFALLFDME